MESRDEKDRIRFMNDSEKEDSRVDRAKITGTPGKREWLLGKKGQQNSVRKREVGFDYRVAEEEYT